MTEQITLIISDPDIVLRNITEDDILSLIQIYKSTREEELAMTPWTDQQKQIFVESQFAAQHSHYQKYYTNAHFWLITLRGKIAGRLYLDHAETEVRIVDIALLPGYRNAGMGTGILKDIQSFCTKLNKKLSIHVEQFNPALHLYKRMGFREVCTVNGIYYLMEWVPKNENNGI